MSNNIARLGVVMGLDTAEFTTGLQAANKALDEFKSKLVEFASIAAFAEMTKKAMEYADTITTTAKANDVATSSVLELSKALEENGGSAEETGRIYSGFNQKVETAALGSAKAQESFARLGVSMNDIKNLSSQDLFNKTITGLAKIEDSVTRNGLAFQVLGKGIRGIDLVGLAQTLEEVRGAFDKYAYAVDQAHELHLKLEASGKKVTLMFTDAVIPSLKVAYDYLSKTGGALDYIATALKYLVVGTTFWIGVFVTGIRQILDGLNSIGWYLIDMAEGKFSKAWESLKKGFADVKKDGDQFLKFVDDLKKANTAVAGGGDGGKANRDTIDALAKQLGIAQNLSKEYADHAKLQLQMVIQQRELLGLTKDQALVQQAVNKVLDDAQQKLIAIDKQIAAAKGQGAAGARLVAVYKQQQQEIIKTRDIYIQATKDEVQATIDFQRTYEFGWQKAWNQFKEDAGNNAKITEDAFNSVLGNMNSAIDTFVKTGKLSFGDLAASILQDLEKIILKALLMKAITGMSGMMNGMGGSAYGMDFQAFAGGGDPPVGTPSLVGENGPELFIPKSAGTVIPNNQLSKVIGGGGQSITYNGPYIANMSAIDTQSSIQFIAKNQTAIWSANQAAQRGLPQSR